jgi:tetratricopeptide (TPR) repeat protein
MPRRFLAVFPALLLLLVPACQQVEQAGKDEAEMRGIFEEARKLDAAGRHHDALVCYETILGRHPEWMSTRLNAAMAAYDAGEYGKSAGHFEVLHRFGPTDWFVIRKLIQCYERLGQKEKVDEFRKKITDLRNAKDGSPLLKSYQGFSRDYLPVGSMHLIGYEFFEPAKHGRLWLFRLEDYHRNPLSTFLLHSSPFHNSENRRLFYLVEGCPGWMRLWYVGIEGRDYEWARNRVLEILQGKHAPLLVKPLPPETEVFEVPEAGKPGEPAKGG